MLIASCVVVAKIGRKPASQAAASHSLARLRLTRKSAAIDAAEPTAA
jgi:hypothetical protein